MFIWAMRDKASEWKALRLLRSAGSFEGHILVEAVCEPLVTTKYRKAITPQVMMERLGEKIASTLDSRVWLDVDNLQLVLDEELLGPLLRIAARRRTLFGDLLVPVVRASSPSSVAREACRLANEHHSGLCIRVDGLAHLAVQNEKVERIISESGLDASAIDLIADAKDLPWAHSHEELERHLPICGSVRTWAVLAGTFPSSITPLDPDTYEHILPRDEWVAYAEGALKGGTLRTPTYGDYATQPAMYSISPGFAPSHSVRYTTEYGYVVIRGRGGKNAPRNQFVGHSRYLRTRDYYRAVASTLGDAYAERIATGGSGPGSPSTWRVASICRHLGVVATQVAALRVRAS
jgi:hypothetical protein